MSYLLIIAQTVFALILIILILIQSKGTGIGRSWGATSTSFTRRGFEKYLFKTTFVVAFIFIAISFLQMF